MFRKCSPFVIALAATFTVAIFSFFSLAPDKKNPVVCIAFYNLENLFDTIDQSEVADEEFLPQGANEWNSERFLKKEQMLARVIAALNHDMAPDVLGVCELENRGVLETLVKQSPLKKDGYEIVHFDSEDGRGIDVALLYKKKNFKVLRAHPYHITFSAAPNEKTRPVLLVSGILQQKDTIHFLVNHFPSRRGGEEVSRQKRADAAMVVSKVCDSLLAVNEMAKIVIMGDFNDEPMDSSIYHVIGARDFSDGNARFFNAMLPLKKGGLGSYKYKDQWNMLDQMLLSKGLVRNNEGFIYQENSAAIFSPEWLQETDPKYKGSPFRTYAGKKYLGGYSDHFPVSIQLTGIGY